MRETPPRLTIETRGSGIHHPRDWRRFSPDQSIVLGMYTGDKDHSSVVVWCLEPGQEISTHRHPDSAHFTVALEGAGERLRGDEGSTNPIRGGQVLIIPRNVIHGIRNTGKARLSYVAASTAGYQREPVAEQTGKLEGPVGPTRRTPKLIRQPHRERHNQGGSNPLREGREGKEETHADDARHKGRNGYGPDTLRGGGRALE